jgi:DNA-directed RNA polymerase specialized sigma24 family protein
VAGGAIRGRASPPAAVAYRMLGDLTEADDAVQESWLHLSRSDRSGVENLGGWLTTVVARVCLDMLRSRNSRREEPLEADVSDSSSTWLYWATDEPTSVAARVSGWRVGGRFEGAQMQDEQPLLLLAHPLGSRATKYFWRFVLMISMFVLGRRKWSIA